ncbi:MAG: hypothetical protein GX968_08285 [Tissierellia bacterium]|nr:hypothetical protein [Tissierellia bacterium]
MARAKRIEYKGAMYHLIQRGSNREFIFKNDIYKGYLIKLIKEAKGKHGFNFYGYVIMGNHYHLLIQTMDIPISKIMHEINLNYAKYYNYKENRTGPVFGDRYKGILVENETYLLQLLKYLHLNPVEAGICPSVDNYKWSSDVFYRRNMRGIVDIDPILNMISQNRIEAIRKYMEFMDSIYSHRDFHPDVFENLEIIGSEEFLEEMLAEYNEEIPSLDEILRDVCPSEKEYNLIKLSCRKRNLTDYKIKYIAEARKFGYSFVEIGKYIGISDSAAIRLLDRHIISQ